MHLIFRNVRNDSKRHTVTPRRPEHFSHLSLKFVFLKGMFRAKNGFAKHETNLFLHYFLLPFPSKTRPPNSNEMRQTEKSDLSREYSIITEINESFLRDSSITYFETVFVSWHYGPYTQSCSPTKWCL